MPVGDRDYKKHKNKLSYLHKNINYGTQYIIELERKHGV